MRPLFTWGRVQRPWGYEVRVDFVDDAGAIYNEVLTFPMEPSIATLNEAIAARQEHVEMRLATEATVQPEPTLDFLQERVAALEAEVAAITVEKAALLVERDALVVERDTLRAVDVLDAPVRL